MHDSLPYVTNQIRYRYRYLGSWGDLIGFSIIRTRTWALYNTSDTTTTVTENDRVVAYASSD